MDGTLYCFLGYSTPRPRSIARPRMGLSRTPALPRRNGILLWRTRGARTSILFQQILAGPGTKWAQQVLKLNKF